MFETLIIQEINDYLHRYVPLFTAMQAQLQRCDANGLSIIAPLAPNINDKGIAFGGAMAALAALSGWAMTRTTLSAHNLTGEIVISESSQKFLRPVRCNIVTACLRPDAETIEAFIQRYRERGKARWTLEVLVHDDDELAMRFSGQYAAIALNY